MATRTAVNSPPTATRWFTPTTPGSACTGLTSAGSTYGKYNYYAELALGPLHGQGSTPVYNYQNNGRVSDVWNYLGNGNGRMNFGGSISC